ncbi:MAG: tripartite tricarboxylate transporter substrate binding protein [Variibacter sp.]|nr:tripartite tricarboxylate transporter substrate binding protein [Variibacter sp.]
MLGIAGRLAAALGLLALAAPLSAAPARADTYPAQNFRMIVPFGAGGAADLVARPLAQHLSEAIGRTIVIENRPGANGVIGTNVVAKAQPDGYTMLLTTGGFSANPSIIANIPYDAVKDFAPVTQIAVSYGLILMVKPDFPHRTVADVVAYARQHPNKLTYAMLGPGNNTHVTMELFKKVAGIEIVPVPYKSSAENTNAVLSGQVDIAPLSSNSAVPYLDSKQLRALGIAGETRVPALPDIPTLIEQGFPGVVNQGYFGVWFPAGTPAERVQFMYRAIKQALQTPAMQKFIADAGYGVVGSTPAEFADFLVKDIAAQRAVLDRIGIRPK